MSDKHFDRFMKRLLKMQPLDKCQVDVDLTKIESEDESIDDLNDIWLTIDSMAFLKNSFLSVEQKTRTKDLGKILYTIVKRRLLIPISDLRIDYQNILKGMTSTETHRHFGKILITDDKSRALLTDIIDMKSLKEEPIGICGDYNLSDTLPPELKRKYHLIYMICLSEMSDEEFSLLYKCLTYERSKSQTVFSFYILKNSCERLIKINDLKQKAYISGVFQLGGFQCIDHNIVVIDNTLNMDWLTKINVSDEKSKKSIEKLVERLSQRLANFLEQIGEFPTVFRYYESFHLTNKLIGDRVLKKMTEFANRRKKSNEMKHESNYELLIIDRTVDLITPLTHCLQFRPFVFNELEKQYENDMNTEYRKLETILVNNTSQIMETFDRIRIEHFSKDNDKDDALVEKTRRNMDNASQAFSKLKSDSFTDVLALESKLLEKKTQISTSSPKLIRTLKRLFKKLVSQTDSEITINDLNRILIINNLFAKSATKKDLKRFVGQNEEHKIDWTVVEDFIQLTKMFVKIENFSATNPKISRIVSKFFGEGLSDKTFPVIFQKPEGNLKEEIKRPERKLILFILGGLSYNDLTSIPDKYQNNVIFCANGLITPKMFIDSIIYE